MNNLKKFPDVYDPPHPPLLRILDIHTHFFLFLLKLVTNSGKFSSVDVRMRPRYLNAVTLASRWPYSWNDVSVPARASK